MAKDKDNSMQNGLLNKNLKGQKDNLANINENN